MPNRRPHASRGGRGRRGARTPASNKKSGPRQSDADKRLYNSKILESLKMTKFILDVPSREMQNLRIQFARQKFNSNLKYRAFHLRVASLFAAQLVADYKELEA